MRLTPYSLLTLDLYGSSEKTIVPLQSTSRIASTSGKKGLTLNTCDSISSYGGIRNMVMGLVGDDVSTRFFH